MKNAKVVLLEPEGLYFDNGFRLFSNHQSDCCEHHYLSFRDLTINDFEGLEFDLSNDNFFKKIPGYGIELIPVKGYSVKVPGYGSNNGCYSDNLSLVIINDNIVYNHVERTYDITECQDF